MVSIGNFLFHFRNFLFPLFYIVLLIPSPEITDKTSIALSVGFIVALSGQLIRILTIGLVYIIRGGSKRTIFAKDLVTEGIFSHCRNPLYLGNILILLGLGIMANSVYFITIIFPILVFFYQAIVLAEENYLSNHFGENYDIYRRNVHRWIPRISGIADTIKSMSFNWKRVILKEYNSTFIWLSGAVIIMMKDIHKNHDRFDAALPYSISTLIFLLIFYGTIRYLKKTKILKND